MADEQDDGIETLSQNTKIAQSPLNSQVFVANESQLQGCGVVRAMRMVVRTKSFRCGEQDLSMGACEMRALKMRGF
jgi:hypothetical protein